MYGSRYQAYRQTEVTTADPKRLVILCYEGAIRNLKTAQENYLSKNFEGKGKAIQNALDIISELREALNFEKGGEIAQYLDSIYSFMTRYILKADRTRDTQGFEHVGAMLEELKSAWEEIFHGQGVDSSAYASSPAAGLTQSKGAGTIQYGI
jgi:flagellar secretion chaperone FliS